MGIKQLVDLILWGQKMGSGRVVEKHFSGRIVGVREIVAVD